MSVPASHQLREGNRALDSLVAKYQPHDPKVAPLVQMLPQLSAELIALARGSAADICAALATNAVSRLCRAFGSIFSGLTGVAHKLRFRPYTFRVFSGTL